MWMDFFWRGGVYVGTRGGSLWVQDSNIVSCKELTDPWESSSVLAFASCLTPKETGNPQLGLHFSVYGNRAD